MDGLISQDIARSPESLVDPHTVGIATTTFYPHWFSGEIIDYSTVNIIQHIDKLRGDLAIRTLREAQAKGFQIVVVDGGSSEAFSQALRSMGIVVQAEQDKGMSGSRRQVLREASNLSGVKIVVWTEPEKISIVRDCLPDALVAIAQGGADIVIPQRDKTAFATYPEYQVRYEERANSLWNEILRKHHLLPEEAENLDAWFGPRFIRNDPAILGLFMHRYTYDRRPPLTPRDEKHAKELGQIYNTELWSDSTFLPIVIALHQGFRVRSVPVNYVHPPEQTASEQDSKEFTRKRDIQLKNIIIATINLIKKLERKPRSRFS